MANEGAVITGPKPKRTPSLEDDQSEFDSIVNELWSDNKSEKKVGKGKVYSGYTLPEVLESLVIKPDFTYSKPLNDTEVLYVHRQLSGADIYWVNNRKDRVEDLEATFRVSGKEAGVWHPETGFLEKASYSISDGVTMVQLHLEPNDAIFVVFRNKAKVNAFSTPEVTETNLTDITGPWEVSFESKVGKPFQADFETLSPWNENSDVNIKYFSGTGTYTKTINIPAEWINGEGNIFLDLGEGENLAEVTINGKPMGIVWKKPFKIDVTNALKKGDNELQIKVVNLWVNRLIGDQQPNVKQTLTYTTMPFYRANSPLKPSGLLGPVSLIKKNWIVYP
jgi:hypothetical protein